MKKQSMIIWLFATLMMTTAANAQPGELPEDKVRQLRIAFITENLELTPDEAEKFWPVFNAYTKERKNVRGEIRQINETIESGGASENQVRTHIERIYTLQIQEAEAQKKMLSEVLPILGPVRTGRLMGLEDKFRQKLIQRFKERKMGPGGGGFKRY